MYIHGGIFSTPCTGIGVRRYDVTISRCLLGNWHLCYGIILYLAMHVAWALLSTNPKLFLLSDYNNNSSSYTGALATCSTWSARNGGCYIVDMLQSIAGP